MTKNTNATEIVKNIYHVHKMSSDAIMEDAVMEDAVMDTDMDEVVFFDSEQRDENKIAQIPSEKCFQAQKTVSQANTRAVFNFLIANETILDDLLMYGIYLTKSQITQSIMQSQKIDRATLDTKTMNEKYLNNMLETLFINSNRLRNCEVTAVLGSGSFGCVLSLVNNNEIMAVKIIYREERESLKNEEAMINRQLSACLGIAPKVYFEEYFDILGSMRAIIAMEPMDLSVTQYLQCLRNVEDRKLQEVLLHTFMIDMTRLFLILKCFNLTHADCHSSNVMCKFNTTNSHFKPYFVDFGRFQCLHLEMLDISIFVKSIASKIEKIEMTEKLQYYFATLARLMYPDNPYWKKGSTDPMQLYDEIWDLYEDDVFEGKSYCKKYKWVSMHDTTTNEEYINQITLTMYTKAITILNRAIEIAKTNRRRATFEYVANLPK